MSGVDTSRSNVDGLIHDIAKTLITGIVIKASMRYHVTGPVMPSSRDVMSTVAALSAWYIIGRPMLDKSGLPSAVEDALNL